MGIGRDGPDEGRDHERGDRSTDDESGDGGRGADDADIASALAGILEEGEDEEELFEETDGDPGAVLEEFDGETPEDVVEVEPETGTETETEPEPETESDEGDAGTATPDGETAEAVSGLFEDLDDVDATPVEVEPESGPATETTGGGTAVEAGGAETAVEPSAAETTDEVEGLLDDLTTVDVDVDVEAGADAAETPTAHTEPTVLDPDETGATGFQWLGEDVQVFSSDGDPDAVLEEFEESTPEEVIAAAGETGGVSATDLFGGLADGGPDYPATAPTGNGQGERARTVEPASVHASDLFANGTGETASTGDGPTTAEELAEEWSDDDAEPARETRDEAGGSGDGDTVSPETAADEPEAAESEGADASEAETGAVDGHAAGDSPERETDEDDGDDDASRGILGRIAAAIRGLF